jgi:hypothetical protein
MADSNERDSGRKLDMDALRALAAAATNASEGATARTHCPNCDRSFRCIKPSTNCWCLKVERNFDFTELVKRTGQMSCVCPVCLTGSEDARDDIESPAS